MSARLRTGLLLLGLTALLPRPAASAEWWRDGDRALEFNGSVREILTVTNGTDPDDFTEQIVQNPVICLPAATFASCPAFDVVGDRDVWESLTRLRLQWDLTWGDRFSAHVAYDNQLRLGIVDSTIREASPVDTDTFLGLEDDIHLFGLRDDTKHAQWQHLVYRGYVRWSDEHFQTTVGRQRIPWGVGRLWNPIDRFNAIPPLAIEQDQSPGIDAVEARWRFSGFDYLQAVYAPGTSRATARYALRYHGVVEDLDVSFMFGMFDEAPTAGFDLAGNLGDAAFRVEVVYTDPKQEVWIIGDAEPSVPDRFWEIVGSVDMNFDVGTGLYVVLEHLYNGNALGFGDGLAGSNLAFFEATADAPPGVSPQFGPFVQPVTSARFAGSRVVSLAENQTGLQLGMDMMPTLRGNLLVLYDWEGGSAAFAPSATFSGFNNADITLGVQLFTGGKDSQFGEAEALAYAVVEFFF